MPIVATSCGVILIAVILWEGFETVVLPRRVTRRFRFTRFFYRATWRPWKTMVDSMVPAEWRETWLSVFGPLSLLLLLSLWACGLIAGFGLLHWAAGSGVPAQSGGERLLTDLYLSGTTFFTLGIGDVVPRSGVARFLVVAESGLGFAFLALVIGYLPGLNQAFARREVSISLLDASAGSPPTASEMLRRHGQEGGMESLRHLLQEWERWSAEFLEGHLSYPVLAYFRSQHDNESWLAALTAILDTCALIMAGRDRCCSSQAKLTFAMARHAVVDLCLVFRTGPRAPEHDRLPPEAWAGLWATVAGAGITLHEGENADRRLRELRATYEPYIEALAAYFHTGVPPWIDAETREDNWQGDIPDSRAMGGRKSRAGAGREHF